MRKIELLAPARNLACGQAAVDHGADAVYIGASNFGARAAAGNSIEDISELVQYAHRFGVKVYVTLNTVLTDEQLDEARKLIHALYAVDVDALIIQDMGILKMDLPPIALHASTQTDNRTAAKVQFLHEAGISRVVLARELNLKQIQAIHKTTDAELEVFVHGSLCVSYSGQCYISQAMSGRSANRGECAQYCRLPYRLIDSKGLILMRDKHLLSLKDLDLSGNLEELMDAGVTSFKIEGRLKDVDYVKNLTAFYRQKIDAILDREGQELYCRASQGEVKHYFQPDPDKSFRRSSTYFFLNGRQSNIIEPRTPKSVGEPLGTVLHIDRISIEVQTDKALHNGDGLAFFNEEEELKGFRVNEVKGGRIYPNEMPLLKVGTFLYRNQDHEFEKLLQGHTADRKLAVQFVLTEHQDGFTLKATEEGGAKVQLTFTAEKQEARDAVRAEDTIRTQLSKSGNTPFNIKSVTVDLSKAYFFPASLLNDWRRQALEKLEQSILDHYQKPEPAPRKQSTYPEEQLSYLGNVTNSLAKAFYLEQGVLDVQPGFELQAREGVPLMFCKHCIKYEMGWCPREGSTEVLAEPLFLEHSDKRFQLDFDCKQCIMTVSSAGESALDLQPIIRK